MNKIIGKSVNRVDGRLKVTGEATYTGDIKLENLVYGRIIQSRIARGRVSQIDTEIAANTPGVIAIITQNNCPKFNNLNFFPGGQSLPLLQDDQIYYLGQPLGVVIAETQEQANYGASLVGIKYEQTKPTITWEEALTQGHEPEKIFGFLPAKITRGDLELGEKEAEIILEQLYTTPMEHHNPLEPSATTATWEGDKLTLYDTTQGVFSTQKAIAQCFNLPPENVRVVSQFLGGGFGCKALVWPHTILAGLAALYVKRPVKIVLTRKEMYTGCGYRAPTRQYLTLGATKGGNLTLLKHHSKVLTSWLDNFIEPCGLASNTMYACPNLEISYYLGKINTTTPTFMRAPGEAPGMFALESAMDELAYALELDPIQLRLNNYAQVDPSTGKPWSSKSLEACYYKGSELFGWEKRPSTPRSMGNGNYLVGWGMSSAAFPANSTQASAKVKILTNGEVIVQSATHDLGTGTYTIMTQVAAEALGLGVEKVKFQLGDTNLPNAPLTGNSMTTSSVAPAVHKAALTARNALISKAIQHPNSPLYQVSPENIDVDLGRVFLKQNPTRGETYQEILTRQGESVLEVEETVGTQSQNYSSHAFGANFVEVWVDSDLGLIQVTRYVGVYAAGRILNPKTARSQMIGGIVGGIGMALMEETVIDRYSGSILNNNFSDYLVPVNGDIPPIEIEFIPENDPYVNPMGTKGIGEISIVGVAAAIANAVYHATGKRIRDLPLTPDKLLG